MLSIMDTAPDRPRRPGRPTIGVRVPVRLPDELVEQIDRRARILGRSRASIIRSLLLEALGDSAVPDNGVDRAQIRRSLALTPRERIEHMTKVHAQQARLRGPARQRPR
jgi:metal-responsive CopG/Arc/MetJ family transcriptional regulator